MAINRCENCKKEFESKRKDARFCSPNCRVTDNRKGSIVTDNVTDKLTMDKPQEAQKEFKFTIKIGENNPEDVEEEKSQVRTARYWYDVPLAAIPVLEGDMPKMPDYMHGRQYFLWWKNDFKDNGGPVLWNPHKATGEVKYDMGGETSRKWGA